MSSRSPSLWQGKRLEPWQWLLLGAVTLIILLFLALPYLNAGSANTERQVAHAAPNSASPIPSCPALETVDHLVRQAQYDTASAVAQHALASNLCPTAERQQLASLALATGLSAITAAPARPADLVAQHGQVERYQDLVSLAQEYQVSLPKTLRQIATDFYSTSAFIPATSAFTDALQAGELGPIDQIPLPDIRFIVSSYYNAGYHLTSPDASADSHMLGLRYLVTSCRIDRDRQAGDGVACGRLRYLLSSNEWNWPEPLDTPLLST